MANRVAGEQTVLLRKAGRVINPPMKKLDRMPTHAEFAHVTDWVFDLDNTLYPHHVNLFSQIDRNMTAYVAELLSLEPTEAKKLQKEYYRDHGTTLQGLMLHHGIDPNDFLERAHAIDYSVVPAIRRSARRSRRCPDASSSSPTAASPMRR